MRTSIPVASALRAAIKNYSFQTLRCDFTAGLIVSLIALPLSMALSIAVGLPPQHGLYTAIVAGIAAALMGGSMTQVSGPTAAFVVIVAPIVSQYGLHGIIWCQIIAGAVLIGMGMTRLGKLIHYVPYPVTTGFTAGIGVTIGTLALNDFFGLGIENLQGHYIEKASAIIRHLPAFHAADLTVGVVTLMTLALFPRITAKIPSTVAAVILGGLTAWLFTRNGHDVATLLTRFSYQGADGAVHPGLPSTPPALHWPVLSSGDLFSVPGMEEFHTLLGPALVIAALAALESLLSATVADSMTGTRHDPNAELSGIGIANILSGLAAGIPATGAIARTATNIHSGAKTPMASVIHALLILIYMMTLAPLISHIPMATLAALLLMTAWRMSHARQFIRVLRLAPRSDVAVLVTCFALTVFVDMVIGVSVGMALACLLFMKRISESTETNVSQGLKSQNENTMPSTADVPPAGTLIYHIEGPLFFGTVEKTMERVNFVNDDVRHFILDLTHVPMIDMTGMIGVKTFLMSIVKPGRTVTLRGRNAILERIKSKIADTPELQSVEMVIR